MRVAVLLAVTLAGACSGKSGAEAARRSAEQEQIRLAVARAVEALNAGDVEAMVAMHTSDAVVLKPHARPERGLEAIGASLAELVERFEIRESRTMEEVTIAGDWAIVWGEYEVRLTPRQGGEGMGERGKYLDVLRKEDGEWKFARSVWNTSEP